MNPTQASVAVVSNTPVVTKNDPGKQLCWQSFKRYCHDSWVLELGAMILSIFVTVAIAVVLKSFE